MISKQIHVKKPIHRGLVTSQGKRKKHLPVMKVYEHQVQRSHKFCRVFERLYMTRQYFFHRANYGHFRQLRLVSIWRTLNQTRRCSAVRSHLFELINDIIYLN